MSLFRNATMKKMSAMSFYKTIPGIIIDGDLTEEEAVVEEEAVAKAVESEESIAKESDEEPEEESDEDMGFSLFDGVAEPVQIFNNLWVSESGESEFMNIECANVEEALRELKAVKKRISRKLTTAVKNASTEKVLSSVNDFEKSTKEMIKNFKRMVTMKGEASDNESLPCEDTLLLGLLKLNLLDEPPKPLKKIVKKVAGASSSNI
jgi:hypothetical protein